MTIDIPARKMVGVIGPDGVGKSTLLALISGVRTIQSRQSHGVRRRSARAPPISRAFARASPTCRRGSAAIFIRRSAFSRTSISSAVCSGSRRSERRAKITELLTATGLDPFEDRPAGKLSGGMKQKLSLCCALINDPDLLILDEPTTGVDPLSRGQFWDLINTIRARRPQMSVMVATAYMDEAQRFDWLMAMDDGKVIASGTLQEMLRQGGRADARGSLHRAVAGSRSARSIKKWSCARASPRRTKSPRSRRRD